MFNDEIRTSLDLIQSIFIINILKEHNKIIGQHLSSGLDTRCILSVLLKHGIKPICYTYDRKDDIEISKHICKDYNLKHIIFKVKGRNSLEFNKELPYKEVDVVFSGLMMSEYLNYYNYPLHTKGYIDATYYSHIPRIYELNDKIRCPIIDFDLLQILKTLPYWVRRKKQIQQYIINNNYPELLNYPYHNIKDKYIDYLLSKVVKYINL